jgi:hypothetical protein
MRQGVFDNGVEGILPRSNGLMVVGAYGRNYKTFAEALVDWHAGKDFRIVNGPYCSIAEVGIMKDRGVRHLTFIGGCGGVLGRINRL